MQHLLVYAVAAALCFPIVLYLPIGNDTVGKGMRGLIEDARARQNKKEEAEAVALTIMFLLLSPFLLLRAVIAYGLSKVIPLH